MAMRTLHLQYFAILRDQAGCAAEDIKSVSRTTADLYGELRERYNFPENDAMKVAVNDEFKSWTYELNDGDLVVFIPPVAGG